MGEVRYKEQGVFERRRAQHFRPAWNNDKICGFYKQCMVTRMRGLAEFEQTRMKSIQAAAKRVPQRSAVLDRCRSIGFELVVEFDELE